ncbi:hypothetical protein HN51_026888 [Arachis hypogaea]|nr:uncharacterized protein DS421_9g255560 [Arachis hypogaea]
MAKITWASIFFFVISVSVMLTSEVVIGAKCHAISDKQVDCKSNSHNYECNQECIDKHDFKAYGDCYNNSLCVCTFNCPSNY